jgi:predicted metal-dependent hydrolase
MKALPKAPELLAAWYKDQARLILPERTNYFAHQFGLKVRSIRITSARTRWGSCSRLNALSFTWRLVMAPLEIIDYIVVHELAHIAEKNHSRAFWSQVERMLPDYHYRRKWLKNNGRLLDLSIDADESLTASFGFPGI